MFLLARETYSSSTLNRCSSHLALLFRSLLVCSSVLIKLHGAAGRGGDCTEALLRLCADLCAGWTQVTAACDVHYQRCRTPFLDLFSLVQILLHAGWGSLGTADPLDAGARLCGMEICKLSADWNFSIRNEEQIKRMRHGTSIVLAC